MGRALQHFYLQLGQMHYLPTYWTFLMAWFSFYSGGGGGGETFN